MINNPQKHAQCSSKNHLQKTETNPKSKNNGTNPPIDRLNKDFNSLPQTSKEINFRSKYQPQNPPNTNPNLEKTSNLHLYGSTNILPFT